MRQNGAFEVFDMCAHLAGAVAIRLGDEPQVMLEGIEVDQQTWGVEICEARSR